MLPDEGKYFHIINNDCKLAVGIKDGLDDPSTPVILCEQDEREEHNIWFEDVATGSIKSVANDLCLTYNARDKIFTVAQFVPNLEDQQWTVGDGYIVNRKDPNKVLDANVPLECGTKLCVGSKKGQGKWKVEYLKPWLFYIRSQMNKSVLEIFEANPNAGAELMTYTKNPDKPLHQLWYEDKNGNVKSALNHFVFDGSDPGKITLQPMDENKKDQRQWIRYGHVVCNRANHNIVLDILKSEMSVPARIGTWEYNGEKNQCWWWEYVD